MERYTYILKKMQEQKHFYIVYIRLFPKKSYLKSILQNLVRKIYLALHIKGIFDFERLLGTAEPITVDDAITIERGINLNLLSHIQALQPEKDYKTNDIDISNLFAELYRNQIRFNATSNDWYYFNGKVWIKDSRGMYASSIIEEFVKTMLTYSMDIDNEHLIDFFIKSLNTSRRETLLKDSKNAMFISQIEFDKNKNLFNVQNGTLNVKTFQFTSHNGADLLSSIANTEYNSNSICERWEQFIDEVMEGNEAKKNYLQKWCGYALTTDTSIEQCLILYGKSTRNGKGTLMETVLNLMGDYAKTASADTIAKKAQKDSRNASSDIARLKNCRMLNVSEPEKKLQLDNALVKNMVGRDTLTCRGLYQEEIEFTPIFKFFMNCNYLPNITDNTVFESERINVLEFNKHFNRENQDGTLKDKFKEPENMKGIFNWCLDGLKKYYEEGLIPPEEVKQATEEYARSSDRLMIFFEEELIKSDKNITCADAYRRYEDWCRRNGGFADGRHSFIEELKRRNLYKPTGTVNGMTCRNVIGGYEFKPFY